MKKQHTNNLDIFSWDIMKNKNPQDKFTEQELQQINNQVSYPNYINIFNSDNDCLTISKMLLDKLKKELKPY
jgi:hypothetical protein